MFVKSFIPSLVEYGIKCIFDDTELLPIKIGHFFNFNLEEVFDD